MATSPEVRASFLTGRAGKALLAALLLAVAASVLLAAEVYGKPLKGLSAVPVRDLVAAPERFAGRDVRVTGPNAGEEGRPALRDGEALLPIVADGSFELPARLGSARLTAEGRVRKEASGVVFVATGLEVRR